MAVAVVAVTVSSSSKMPDPRPVLVRVSRVWRCLRLATACGGAATPRQPLHNVVVLSCDVKGAGQACTESPILKYATFGTLSRVKCERKCERFSDLAPLAKSPAV